MSQTNASEQPNVYQAAHRGIHLVHSAERWPAARAGQLTALRITQRGRLIVLGTQESLGSHWLKTVRAACASFARHLPAM